MQKQNKSLYESNMQVQIEGCSSIYHLELGGPLAGQKSVKMDIGAQYGDFLQNFGGDGSMFSSLGL